MWIISPITTFDEDQELWETKIGTNEEDMPLKFSAWGKTEEESRDNGEKLLQLLYN